METGHGQVNNKCKVITYDEFNKGREKNAVKEKWGGFGIVWSEKTSQVVIFLSQDKKEARKGKHFLEERRIWRQERT